MNKQAIRANAPRSLRWVLMGVSGAGKSEIGRRLALRLGDTYVEGDDYHTPRSVRKMSAGVPLEGPHPQGGLQTLPARNAAAREHGDSPRLACSGLKRRGHD